MKTNSIKNQTIKMKHYSVLWAAILILACSSLYAQTPRYLKGDFHQHTTYTDGSWSFPWVMYQDTVYKLDWWANSEHGGGFTRNAQFSGKDKGSEVFWDSYVPSIILGRNVTSGGHRVMWRWQSLKDSSFSLVRDARTKYPQKTIIQGYEWNVPGHEHASMAIINNQFLTSPNCLPLSEFEYKFDNSDQDTAGGASMGWTKSTASYNQHAKTIEALNWLNKYYPFTSWAIPAHPERKSLYTIGTFREMNDVAPSVCFGFESATGHQRSSNRGEYSKSNNSVGKATYGGVGYYSATIGGLWDAMLSEGRNYWLFASSDFHDTIADFYPGEYQKTYTYGKDKSAQSIVDGLRSGNSWVVLGDLIDSLNFRISKQQDNSTMAYMGQTLYVGKDSNVTINIILRDPQTNNHNRWSSYTNPSLHHIDIIAGQLRERLAYSSNTNSDYQKKDTVGTTSVVARFDASGGYVDGKGIVSQAWTDLGNGVKSITFTVKATKDMYFRLRGSNLAVNTANQLDANGNPLCDTLVGSNDAVKAFADLWFYSNPIFVKTRVINQQTINVKISKATDDLEEYLPAKSGQTLTKVVGDVDAGSSDLELGAVTTGTEDPQLVGLRFPGIFIPKNAVITSAKIEFEVDQNNKNASPCDLYIYAENNDNPVTFPLTAYALTSRSKIADSVYWFIDSGDGEVIDSKIESSDISKLVQKLVDRSGWIGGNAMAFYIKGSGTREFESYDGEPNAAATLKIKFYVKKTIKNQIAIGSDDVEEWIAPQPGQTQSITIGLIDSTSSDLELGCENGLNTDPQMVGLRFQNINVPGKSYINKAYIEFEVDAVGKNANPTELTILTENNDNPVTFNYQLNSLSNRPKLMLPVQWNIPSNDFNVVNNKGQSANIRELVYYNFGRSAWKTGDAMAFYITGKGLREVESYEGEKGAAASLVIEYYGEYTRYDSILDQASRLADSNYTVPSWTEFKKAYTKASKLQDSASCTGLEMVMKNMQPREMPYSIAATFNGDPATRMGFAWFTNSGITGGKIEIVEDTATSHNDFSKPDFSINAVTTPVNNLNYCVSANDLLNQAGFATNSKRSYVSNKALASNLKPNTTYSYRVGKSGAWSEIGMFKTAHGTKDKFSFIYFTDPQANTDDMFYISQKTTHSAMNMYPNANFWLSCGDLIETSGTNNSEWEYEQFFQTQQDIWYKKPFAPVIGNHDKSANKNFTYHYNTPVVPFDSAKATTPGSVYSYVYGDALFMAISFEDYSVTGYLDSISNFVKREVAAHKDVRWRIVYYHKTIYTGSGSHQSDADGKVVRDKLAPLFDSLKIDWALQGHDHIYEVIGPIKNKKVVSNAISNQTIVPRTVRDNVTGKLGGIFDVKDGTLYFLNNSGGRKKYEPRDSATMKANEAALGLTDYFTFFTGRFGQTGEPTFSYITVSTDTIEVKTYTVDDAGNATLFDAYKIVDSYRDPSIITWSNPSDIVYGTLLDSIQLNATANVAGTFTYTPAAGTKLNAGNNQMLIVKFKPKSSNYREASDTVYINVLQIPSVVSWSNPSDIIYGTALGATQLNATASTTGVFTYNPASGTVLNAGTGQLLTVEFVPTDSNYSTVIDSVYINVLKAISIITWNNPSDIIYGTALGATQLNATAITTGVFTYNPASGTVLNAGTNQLLTVDFVPSSNNYTTVTDSAYINVLKAVPVITWNNPSDITYGTVLSSTQLNASTSTTGVFTYNPPAGTVLNAGSKQLLTAEFAPTNSNYSNVTDSAYINVLKAQSVITWSKPADIVYGTLLGSAQLNATASTSGTFTYDPPSGTKLDEGNNQMLKVDFVPTSSNFSNANSSVFINVLHNTSINLPDESGLEVYPNPVKDELVVKSVKPIKFIYIADMLGNEVFNTQGNFNQQTISVQNLKNGLYLLKIVYLDNTFENIKLVKE
jgi:hypothetical protein